MLTRTPRHISPAILNLAENLVPGGQLHYVAIEPRDNGMVNECFSTVALQVAKEGGRIQHGWTIWEWPTVMVEAEFHAVWEDQDGAMLCVTPRFDGEVRILFLPDPERTFSGELVDNVRVPLSDNPKLAQWIKLAKKRSELVRREKRVNLSGPTSKAEDQMTRIAFQMSQLQREIGDPSTPLISRNGPCPCGGGKPYKRCHGQKM